MERKTGTARVSPEERRAARRLLPVILGSLFAVLLAVFQSVYVFTILLTRSKLFGPDPISLLEVVAVMALISFFFIFFGVINGAIFDILLCFYLTRAEYEELHKGPKFHMPVISPFLRQVHASIFNWRERHNRTSSR
jgi:hypothetical protein